MSDSVWPHRWQPAGSPIPGILQARTLEWVAISFSSAWKWKAKVKSFSHVWLLAAPWTAAYQAPPYMGFSRQEYQSGLPLPSPIYDNHCLLPYMINLQQTLFSMLKTESTPSKIRSKTRVSIFITIIQHSFGSPSYSNQRRKRNKRNLDHKRRSKPLTVCRWYDIVHGKPER